MPCRSLNQKRFNISTHNLRQSKQFRPKGQSHFYNIAQTHIEVLPELSGRNHYSHQSLSDTHCTNLNVNDYIIKFKTKHRSV